MPCALRFDIVEHLTDESLLQSAPSGDEGEKGPQETGIYATLPKSLKADVLVRTRQEDPDVLKERQALVASKSVGELATLTSISDIPIPATIENLLSGKRPTSPSRKQAEAEEG